MNFPRVLLGTALLLAAGSLHALELTVSARESGNHVAVQCRVEGYDLGETLRSLDAGETVRITWQFRLGKSDTTIVRYAHRDSLGEGYIVYGDDGLTIRGPFSGKEAAEELTVLPETILDLPGPWGEEDVLESRVFLDYRTFIPPMSIVRFFSGKRDKTGWQKLPYPGAPGQ